MLLDCISALLYSILIKSTLRFLFCEFHIDKYDALNRNMKYEGENYHIVGAGFLEAWNIYSPISNESPQTLFKASYLS